METNFEWPKGEYLGDQRSNPCGCLKRAPAREPNYSYDIRSIVDHSYIHNFIPIYSAHAYWLSHTGNIINKKGYGLGKYLLRGCLI